MTGEYHEIELTAEIKTYKCPECGAEKAISIVFETLLLGPDDIKRPVLAIHNFRTLRCIACGKRTVPVETVKALTRQAHALDIGVGDMRRVLEFHFGQLLARWEAKAKRSKVNEKAKDTKTGDQQD